MANEINFELKLIFAAFLGQTLRRRPFNLKQKQACVERYSLIYSWFRLNNNLNYIWFIFCQLLCANWLQFYLRKCCEWIFWVAIHTIDIFFKARTCANLCLKDFRDCFVWGSRCVFSMRWLLRCLRNSNIRLCQDWLVKPFTISYTQRSSVA